MIRRPRVGYPLIYEGTEHHLAIHHPRISDSTPQLPEYIVTAEVDEDW